MKPHPPTPAPESSGSKAFAVRITPQHQRTWRDDLAEIWTYRSIALALSKRSVSLRYKQTVIGILWVVLQPLASTAIFTFVFNNLAKVETEQTPYPVFVFCGLLMWQFFSRVLAEGTSSFISNANFITKVYFPRLIIPMIGIGAALIDFCVAFVIFLIVMVIYGVMPPWTVVFLPLIMIAATLFGYSMTLIVAPTNAIYRDLTHVMPFVIQLLMYASPVVYPATLVPDAWRWLYDLNPVAVLATSIRWSLLGEPAPSLLSLAVFCLITAGTLIMGWRVFRRLEATIVDRI